MRKQSLLVVSLLLATYVSVASTAEPLAQASPRQLMDAFTAAWNAGDVRTMVDLHTEDAEYINAGSGHYWRGKDELLRGWQAVRASSGPLPPPKTVNIRELNRETAVVVSIYEVGPPTTPGGVLFIASTVLVKRDDKWFISHGQGTMANVQPPAGR